MSSIKWKEQAKNTEFQVRNFIDGHYVDCQGEPVISKYSPRDGSLLYEFSAGDGLEVDRAVECARKAFDDKRWRGQSMAQRKIVLRKLADLIEEHKDTFALYECLDVGKPITNALQDDVIRAVSVLKDCAESADKLFSPSGSDGNYLVYQTRKPVGVVGGIVGWNYPLVLAVRKVGPALIMGNSLVLKPSEYTSLSTNFLAALALEAGVPPGVFNVVNGAGATVGAALTTHTDVDLISFVGSSTTGKQLMIAAGQSNMKRLILECGGKSPYLVFDDYPSDLDAIAADIVATAFPNQGALCVAGTRLLIHEAIKDDLLPKVLEQVEKVTPQDPLDPSTTFGALVNESHMNKVLGYIDSGKQQGAELVYGGNRRHIETGGYYLEPSIFDNVDPQQKIAQEEIFGPVLSIFSFKNEEGAVKLANDTCYGLAAFAATENLGRAQRLGQNLNVGFVMIAGTTTPSGGGANIGMEGQRQSGFGYEGGLAGLAAYTVSTAVHTLF